ncbi:MAG: hypothetical protein EA402_12225 [Planctomycetota bacterium]|nr:MAG: hypothetical protein EA402_12225 [Planctomycetota bacterium]
MKQPLAPSSSPHQDWDELCQRWLDGSASAEDVHELVQQVEASPELARRLLAQSRFDYCLGQAAQQLRQEASAPGVPSFSSARAISGRQAAVPSKKPIAFPQPLRWLAAAALLAIGCLWFLLPESRGSQGSHLAQAPEPQPPQGQALPGLAADGEESIAATAPDILDQSLAAAEARPAARSMTLQAPSTPGSVRLAIDTAHQRRVMVTVSQRNSQPH